MAAMAAPIADVVDSDAEAQEGGNKAPWARDASNVESVVSSSLQSTRPVNGDCAHKAINEDEGVKGEDGEQGESDEYQYEEDEEERIKSENEEQEAEAHVPSVSPQVQQGDQRSEHAEGEHDAQGAGSEEGNEASPQLEEKLAPPQSPQAQVQASAQEQQPQPPTPPEEPEVEEASAPEQLQQEQAEKPKDFDNAPRDVDTQAVINSLWDVYQRRMLPLEDNSDFASYHYEPITKAEMNAKPLVLVAGPYSSGKTSFLAHVLNREFPAMHIGPQPTTDCFHILLEGEEGGKINGSALCAAEELPFSGLQRYGTALLSRLNAPLVPSPLLEQIVLVDTPGILDVGASSAAAHPGYEFQEVMRWFAGHADLVLLMFDPLKTGVSDEMRAVLDIAATHRDKVRLVLNKVQTVDSDARVKVFGKLMYSLGASFGDKLEPPRVYLMELKKEEAAAGPPPLASDAMLLEERDEAELVGEIKALPKHTALNKMDLLIRRARLLKVHLLLLDHIRSLMPRFWGREAAKKRILGNLEVVFNDVKSRYNLPSGDIPTNIEHYRSVLSSAGFYSLPRASARTLDGLERLIRHDFAECARVAGGGGIASIYNVQRLAPKATPEAAAAAEAAGLPAVAQEAPKGSETETEGEGAGAEARFSVFWSLAMLVLGLLLAAAVAVALSELSGKVKVGPA